MAIILHLRLFIILFQFYLSVRAIFDMTEHSKSNVIETLLPYRKLTESPENHMQLLQDKTLILYAATLLENNNLEILEVCLDIFENFIRNQNSHSLLLATFGLYESLEFLSINARRFDNNIANRATFLTEELRKSTPSAFGTRIRTNARTAKRSTLMYHLHIPELTTLNRSLLDETLVSIKGMVSYVVDPQQQRCTIRIGPRLSLRNVVLKIQEVTDMTALVVTNDRQTGKENHINILDDCNKTLPPDYCLDESLPRMNYCLYYITKNITQNASDMLKNAAEFWNRSFYW